MARGKNRQLAQFGRGQDARSTLQVTQQSLSVGPIPSASELQNYEDVLPGLAERIVAQSEREGDHRRWRDRSFLRLQSMGLALGFVLFFAWFGASFVMIMSGRSVVGAVSGMVAIGAMVTNTVLGYRRRGNT